MGWTDVNLRDVNPNPDPLPAETYVFQLLQGTKMDEGGTIKARAAVAEGEFAGRQVFFSYPNPDEFDWAPKALKVLEIALGVDALPGENPVDYLNRATGNRFNATIKHRPYKTNAGAEGVSVDLQLFSVRPAV
jgi:hypothetical protein